MNSKYYEDIDMKRQIGIKELYQMSRSVSYREFQLWLAEELFDMSSIVDSTKLTDTLVLATQQSEADRGDAEEFLNKKDIWNHPRIATINNDNSFEVADLMAEFTNEYHH